ncbi:MAG: GTP cyclohydrolase MptA [Solirubrobacterales bacterium]
MTSTPNSPPDSSQATAPASGAPRRDGSDPFDRTAPRRDVQSERPRVTATLSRVGVTNVEKIVRISDGGDGNLFHAKLDCFVDLAAAQKGVHMSRFEEVVNEAIDEVILKEAFRAEILAGHIAEIIRERQGGARAEVRIEARYPEHKPAPVSGVRTQEIYTMFGTAVASARGTRKLVGVQAHGMTACPCAQDLVAERSQARLTEHGFTDDQIEQIFDAVPVATHNQRGLASLHVGCPEEWDGTIEAADLLKIAEDSMSSEIYELMKRSDEVEVVEKAHRRPRFVEDCVREMISGVVAKYDGSLGAEAFVFARQENLETIHQHNVVAERYGLIDEVAAELSGDDSPARHLTLREWLDPR